MPDVDTPLAEAAANTPRLERVIAPIAPGSPAGEDVTYEDDFQRVKAEIDKLESASGSGVDYGLVVEVSDKLLAEKSKDLRVAAYLTMGLVNTAGLRGAAEGVTAVNRMLQAYWDELYPPINRLRARRNALQALSDRVKEWVAAERPTAADRAALEAAADEMKELQAFVLDKMGDDAPAVSGLTRAFDDAVRRAGPTESEGDDGEQAPTDPPSGGDQGSPSSPQPDGADTPSGDFRSVPDAMRTVSRVVAYFRSEEETSPLPFKLNRALHWGTLQVLPPNESGKTQIPAPPEQRRRYLSGLLDRGDSQLLVDEVESGLGEAPFWFDLQRLLVAALDQLGEPYSDVRDVILQELALLLERFPTLPELTFSDGTPFADAATTGWLELRVQPVLGRDGAAGAAAEEELTGGGRQLTEYYEEARSLLAQSDLSSALQKMEEGRADDSDRDRFRRRVYIASLCMTGGKPAVARPILERLEQQIQQHRLEAWEPSLTLEVWTLMYRCYNSLAGPESEDPDGNQYQRRAGDVFDRICGLDPHYALSISTR